MVRILPKEKSLFKARRYDRPFTVKKIVVENQYGHEIIRNMTHVKPIRFSTEITIIKRMKMY